MLVPVEMQNRPAAFAAAVAEVLADPAGQAALSAAAQERLTTTYAWQRLGGRLAACYEAVLSPADNGKIERG